MGRRPGVTTGREEMFVAGGYSPHLVVVMASRAIRMQNSFNDYIQFIICQKCLFVYIVLFKLDY